MRALVFVLGLLSAVPVHAAQLTLTWIDHADGQAQFVIERATSPTGAFGYLAANPTGDVSYVDTTVVAGKTYCYRVAAVNDAGQSDYSNVACGKTRGKK